MRKETLSMIGSTPASEQSQDPVASNVVNQVPTTKTSGGVTSSSLSMISEGGAKIEEVTGAIESRDLNVMHNGAPNPASLRSGPTEKPFTFPEYEMILQVLRELQTMYENDSSDISAILKTYIDEVLQRETYLKNNGMV